MEKQSTYKGYTQARNEASQRYNKAHLEQIAIRVPKGKREEYNVLAELKETSITKLITEYLDKEIEQSGQADYIRSEAQKREEKKKEARQGGVISAQTSD